MHAPHMFTHTQGCRGRGAQDAGPRLITRPPPTCGAAASARPTCARARATLCAAGGSGAPCGAAGCMHRGLALGRPGPPAHAMLYCGWCTHFACAAAPSNPHTCRCACLAAQTTCGALGAGEVDAVVGWSGAPAACLRLPPAIGAASVRPGRLPYRPPPCLTSLARPCPACRRHPLPFALRTNNLEVAAPLSGTSLFADCWCIPTAAAGG